MSDLAYLSLGSNIGDREANLASAISALSTVNEILNIKSASFYETEPLYLNEQPPFLNTVVELITDLDPFELLDATKHVEKIMGRSAVREKNEPRTLDIDILAVGDSLIETGELTIPHPGIPERKFVLVPFAELAPEFILPKWNVSVRTLLKLCPDKSEVRKHIIETRA